MSSNVSFRVKKIGEAPITEERNLQDWMRDVTGAINQLADSVDSLGSLLP